MIKESFRYIFYFCFPNALLLRKIQSPSAIFWVVVLLTQIYSTNVLSVERNNEMIAFGDSITAGAPYVWLSNGERVGGYEPDLELLTDARNDHYNVYNYGIGGEITPDGLARFDSVMTSHPLAKYVLILEGTNDIWNSISREDTVWFLSRMIDKARVFGIEPVLGTLTPDPRPNISDQKKVWVYNAMIRSMAEDKNVKLAELYNEMVDDWVSVYTDDDLLHPNRAGYTKMAEVWFKTVFVCSTEYVDQCFSQSECSDAGGYWYGNACNKFPPPITGLFLLLLNN